MAEQNALLTGILAHGSHALAAFTASELLAERAEIGEGFGLDPHAGWQSILRGRIEELAAAVSFRQPALFAAQLRWAKSVLVARGIPVDHVRLAFGRLGDVILSELAEELRPLAATYLNEGLTAFDRSNDDIQTTLLPDTEWGRLAARYLLSVLEGDRRKASRLVLTAAHIGHDVRRLYLEVLLAAQAEAGRMWAAGEINVAEEHFTSSTTKAVMAQLIDWAPKLPHNGRTFLGAAVVGNFHDVGLHAVADFFEMAGWRSVQLGADVPIADLVEAVAFFQPDLLGLSVAMSSQLPALRETIDSLRHASETSRTKIMVGGRVLSDSPELVAQLKADAYAARPDEAVRVAEDMIMDSRSPSA